MGEKEVSAMHKLKLRLRESLNNNDIVMPFSSHREIERIGKREQEPIISRRHGGTEKRFFKIEKENFIKGEGKKCQPCTS